MEVAGGFHINISIFIMNHDLQCTFIHIRYDKESDHGVFYGACNPNVFLSILSVGEAAGLGLVFL